MSSIPCKQRVCFVESSLDGETLLMELENGRFFTLRGSAAVIWTLIDGSRDRAAIASELYAKFDGPPEQIDRELDAFLNQLSEAGFVA